MLSLASSDVSWNERFCVSFVTRYAAYVTIPARMLDGAHVQARCPYRQSAACVTSRFTPDPNENTLPVALIERLRVARTQHMSCEIVEVI